MTREHWKQLLPIIAAFAEGKEIEFLNFKGIWEKCNYAEKLAFDRPAGKYRVKPEPKLRPWKDGEIPLGALWKGKASTFVFTAEWVNLFEIGINSNTIKPENLAEIWLHSLDNGRTWLPCGVMEDGQ